VPHTVPMNHSEVASTTTGPKRLAASANVPSSTHAYITTPYPAFSQISFAPLPSHPPSVYTHHMCFNCLPHRVGYDPLIDMPHQVIVLVASIAINIGHLPFGPFVPYTHTARYAWTRQSFRSAVHLSCLPARPSRYRPARLLNLSPLILNI
jgi:hypothetical protein